MPIVKAHEIVREASSRGYAVAAINCQGGNYDLVRAVLETATEERAPVILMAYEGNTPYYGLGWLPRLVQAICSDYPVPVAVHLDHGQSPETVKSAISSGYTSVMIDYSKRPLIENIKVTKSIVEAAHAAGLSVEAEIGELQRNDGSELPEEPKNLVNPDHVRLFLEQVPVDMLAVGIGNAHGFYKGEPHIRIDLLKQVRAVSGDTPLVLHGTTGIPEPVVKECIRNGMAKINFGTLVRVRFLEYVVEALGGAVEHKQHIWRICRYAAEKVKNEIRGIIQLTESNGKA